MKRLFLGFYVGNLATVFTFWFSISFFIAPVNLFYALGRLFALVGMVGVLIQLMLIGRAKWFEGRYGFDSLAKLHQISFDFVFIGQLF